ncbi:DUF1684 domain-containing protein [Lysobacter sp. CA196]|uniref:DUF1684 domain-containing protein n=1 Tax=Lysobacter sp. CA196 TaxID=3455606 RepID=UPI003F8D43F9
MRALLCSILLLSLPTLAIADPRKDWDDFRAAMTQHAGGPTGMYAIQDVAVVDAGKTVHLTPARTPAELRWTEQAGSKDPVSLSYQNGRALLRGPGLAEVDLLKAKEQQQTLPNGLIVRGTVYEHSIKAWLYNPKLPAQRFKSLSFFPYDPKGVVTATFKRKNVPVGVSHLDSRNHTGLMYWIGDIELPVHGKTYNLRAFNKEKDWTKINHVLLFLTDKTSKKTTYGGGRALETHFPAGEPPQTMALDLNTLYSFLCAHSDYYNCPINLTSFVDTELKYGEKYPPQTK